MEYVCIKRSEDAQFIQSIFDEFNQHDMPQLDYRSSNLEQAWVTGYADRKVV